MAFIPDRNDHRWGPVRSVLSKFVDDSSKFVDDSDELDRIVFDILQVASTPEDDSKRAAATAHERLKDVDIALCLTLADVHQIVDAVIPNKDQNRAVKKLLQVPFDAQLVRTYNRFPTDEADSTMFSVDPKRY